MMPTNPISTQYSPTFTSSSSAHSSPPSRSTTSLNASLQSTTRTRSQQSSSKDERFEQALSDAQKRSAMRNDRQRLRDEPSDQLSAKAASPANQKNNSDEVEAESTQADAQVSVQVADEAGGNKGITTAEGPASSGDDALAELPSAEEIQAQIDGEAEVTAEADQQLSGTDTTQASGSTSAETAINLAAASEALQQSPGNVAQTTTNTNAGQAGLANAASQTAQGVAREAVSKQVVNHEAQGQQANPMDELHEFVTAIEPGAEGGGESKTANSETSEQSAGDGGKAANSGKLMSQGQGPGAGHGPMGLMQGQGAAAMLPTSGSNAAEQPAQALAQVLNTGAAGTTATGGMQSEQDAQAGDVNAARIARGLQSALAQRGGTVTLRLHPPELGLLKIQMEIQDGSVQAKFMTENQAARGLLTQEMGNLRTALEKQGLNVERLEVQMQAPATTSASAGQQSGSQDTMDDGRSRGQFARQQGQADTGGNGDPQGRDRQDEDRPGSRQGFARQLVNAMA